jgi:hypothetical protein
MIDFYLSHVNMDLPALLLPVVTSKGTHKMHVFLPIAVRAITFKKTIFSSS